MIDGLTDLRNRLEESRPRSRTIDSAFLAVARDTETGGGVLAAAVAFRVFMLVIPYIFVIVMAFDVAGSISGADPHSVAKSWGIGGLMAQAVTASAKQLSGSGRFFALAGGLLAVLLAGRALLRTLRTIHGLVWRVRVHKQTRATRAVLVLIALLTMSLLLLVAIDRLRHVSGLGGLGAAILYTAVPGGIWLALEFGLPHAPQAGWKDLLPGAIVFGVAALILHLFTVYWVAHLIKRKSATYGALGVGLALLLWAYVFGRMMTASAVLNASLWARAHPDQMATRPVPATALEQAPGARHEPDEVVDRMSAPESTK
jgi:membrane protein